MKLTTRHWLHGLIAAFIGGGASTFSAMAIDPAKFNFNDGFGNMCKSFLLSGLITAGAYLKQSPIPPEENEKTTPNVNGN
jgi:hypothetical protein